LIISVNRELVKGILKPRDPDSHKGNYGHALLVAGSEGKNGAAVLTAKACLRSGVGLLTVHIPHGAEDILQSTVPEAMVDLDSSEDRFTGFSTDLSKYSTIGIGPGLGTEPETQKALHELIRHCQKPIVIDADGLNILSLNKEFYTLIPKGSILTPHPKEFERLAGTWQNEEDCFQKLIEFAANYSCFIVFKGHETKIVCPDGELYVNTTGNAGMAKGGSGDVLTGMITAFLSQGYSSKEAALLGVYIHGLAGDIAVESTSEYSLLPSDLIEAITEAFKRLL
jgi:NAD(P)H-hydrate epimerase